MKLKIYTYRDTVEGSFGVLLTSRNDELLKRDLKMWLGAKEPNPINQNWKDKNIYCLGEYDVDEGKIIALPTAEFICPMQEVYDLLVADIKKWKEDNEYVGNNETESEN